MATLTIKNIPDAVVRRLKAQAARHRRSLNLEVIHLLETATHAAPIDVEAELAQIRARRPSLKGVRIDDRVLREWKNAGRL
jgi:plasmid stability protein